MITLETIAATGVFQVAWLMIALPALVAGLLLVSGKFFDRGGHWLAVAASSASFVLAFWMFIEMLGADPEHRAVSLPLFDWIQTGSWTVSAGLQIDQLSILFAMLITGVGSLIHLYSVGYMAHDDRRRRFFAYLNLFVAAMLLLVLANDYLVLFVGWEGVGLASYLLIGFWQHKPSAAAAAKKAFVMNRVGDLGLSMAVMSMLALIGSSSFEAVNAAASKLSPGWATAIGLFLLLGAVGKSAQVPLQGWLLDAMEGPTPVSALIHAATMVTAGVYLVVRSHEIFQMSEVASTAVVIVGAVTLLFGAWIGTSKDDIKKVLAGSTMSQIGYMMLAAGIGPAGYAFAIFHLLTHGFFKANMFLGAGSVMHAMNDDVDMRHYGALAKVMRVTFLTFAMGYLAIIGFPFFAGYFSKDHIIEAAFGHSAWAGVAALLGAGITAFYMTRLMLMTFFGEKRWREGVHPHESPKTMTIPLIILGFFSIIGGALMNFWIQEWLEPATGGHPHELTLVPTLVGWLTMAVVAAGVAISWFVFGAKPVPDAAPASGNFFTVMGRNDLFGDTVNDVLVVQPTMLAARGVVVADHKVLDGGFGGLATAFAGISTQVRKLQNGQVRTYALTMAIGVVAVGVVMILSQLG
ncbi:NADH-quinone oxidoreductase subunit L [Propionicimonas sp.]|uniref:NADH-quinone oxidoreductase subunit L n=1 Tax=Propionicimonas sp. TaxID=1955623 RepID=UPI0017B9E829|nr:NADH-quinone oxidoreductase subunit L [Propionicimonas sp.]MBU3977730.1 NADH-quinone oxidoreductase subunit L [Actinomycetota bacterium]MBA3021653.1 NADH-quinone oxidoreductase subunit L [Propionicimonas sp.]MBU3987204.1 NADH-quinone oxidoreductase subunit L [Actinomycetota bacterium]MBU4009025.1 NADH-quinone oxidoreductase subunit L [Actinomycetota bacterium]MBU4065825.1 NADH-quinone oxidoreductase subunit L [Actinomycetota bacterium]